MARAIKGAGVCPALIFFKKEVRNVQIELYINGEKKIFTTPFVPMMAKRKYLELQAKAEQRKEPLTLEEQIKEDDEYLSILSDIVFKGQFTVEDLYNGASKEYVDEKLIEAVFDIKPGDRKKKEKKMGNEQGK